MVFGTEVRYMFCSTGVQYVMFCGAKAQNIVFLEVQYVVLWYTYINVGTVCIFGIYLQRCIYLQS